MEKILSELVERLQKAHQSTLSSVVLYGSGATEEGKDKLSDFNVLCVLKQITPNELMAAEPTFRWWRDLKNPAPLLLSEAEVLHATDCFPIEFHDIKERHRILYGTDLIAGMQVDDSFYRAQVEHEMRAKMLRLRQKAGGVLSDKVVLLRLMAESTSTFCVLFRHVLRLSGSSRCSENMKSYARQAQSLVSTRLPLNSCWNCVKASPNPGMCSRRSCFECI
ncbi:MAG: hypothetical protein WKF37_03855 [Bryobacteraceae bacterium]